MLRLPTGPTVGSMSPQQRWAALVMLAGSLMVVMMDMTILIMALPELARDLNPTATEQLWVVDAYSLILAGLIIPMSAFADRWGRRKVLLLGFGLFGAVSMMVLAADSPGHVIALRAILGAAGAMIMPTTLSMIRTIFEDPKERANALAVWSVVSAIGAVIGPLVGGALLEFFPWQAAFLVNVPIVVAAIAAGLFLLPEARDPNPPRWDPTSTVLSIVGMSSLVWGIKEVAKQGWSDPTGWIALAVAITLLTWFVRRCLNRPDPMLDVRLFKSRPFSAGTTAALTAMFGMAAVLLLVAQWLQVVEGLSPLKAGLALIPMALGSLAFAPFAPALAARIGARTVLAGGLAVAGCGFLLLRLFGAPLTYLEVVPALVLLGAGTGSLAIASAIIMGSTPQEKAGNAAAIEESMYDLGNVLGIAVLGSLAAALYRSYLDISSFSGQITGVAADGAEESIVGALEVAAQTGINGLAVKATEAFTESLIQTSMFGGFVMIAAGVLVYLLIPKSFDFTADHKSGSD